MWNAMPTRGRRVAREIWAENVPAKDDLRNHDGRKMCRSLGEEGFTLLEMLLVICIIGVLAAIAVPKFSQSMTLANTSKIQADLSTLNTAVELYHAEKGVYPKELKQLGDYVRDIDSLKPPSGSYFLRTGETKEAGASYELTAETGKETQATLDKHRIQDFGRATQKETAGQGAAGS